MQPVPHGVPAAAAGVTGAAARSPAAASRIGIERIAMRRIVRASLRNRGQKRGGQEKGRPEGRPWYDMADSAAPALAQPFGVQARMISVWALVPSANLARTWTWSLPSVHLAVSGL